MNYYILIILGISILDTAGYQMTIYVSTSPKVCFALLAGENRTHKISAKINKNTTNEIF